MSDSYWDKDDQLLEEPHEEKAPWWSSRPVVIVFLAVVSIIILSILWHALLPSKPQGNVEVPYVKAEVNPIKTRPADPGGANIPHKDKMVYDLISNKPAEESKQENLQPKPEKPTYDTKFETPVELSEKKETVAVEEVKPIPAPAKTATEKEDTPSKSIDVFKDGVGEPKPVAKPKPTGPKAKYRIQVAALSSQKAAEGQIKTLKRQHASLKTLPIEVTKGTVKGKTYYRVQAGNFQTRGQALKTCSAIKAKGGQCMIVAAR